MGFEQGGGDSCPVIDLPKGIPSQLAIAQSYIDHQLPLLTKEKHYWLQ